MNRYLIDIAVAALLAILPSANVLASATCNCAAQTCTSGGQTFPISKCSECNGVCASSSSSGASSQPVDTQFLKGKYLVPPSGRNVPLDSGRVLPPAPKEWDKKRQQAALLESEKKRLQKEAEAAEKAFEDARKKMWKAEFKLQDAKKLLEAAKNLTKKDKEELVYFAEKKVAAAEAELKKAEAEEQAAKKKRDEAWKKLDDSAKQVRKLLKEADEEEKKAEEAARKEKQVAAAKDKLKALKNQSEVEAAVKAAEKKAAEKKAAEEKAAKALAAVQKKIDEVLKKVEGLADRDMTREEYEAEIDKIGKESNNLSEDQIKAMDDLYDAEREREQADEEAAAMREAAKRLG